VATLKLPKSKKRRDEMLESSRARVDVLRECLSESEDHLLDLERAIVLEAMPGHDEHDIEIGSWECPTSPLKVCAYDREADPCCDDCLFCHDPSERK
jgi:hypothetical protein